MFTWILQTYNTRLLLTETGDISTTKLVDKEAVSHQPKIDIDTRLTKAWIAIDRLSVIRESDLTDKMKRSVDTAIWMHYMDAN